MGNSDYWNHDTAYHPWLTTLADRRRGDVQAGAIIRRRLYYRYSLLWSAPVR